MYKPNGDIEKSLLDAETHSCVGNLITFYDDQIIQNPDPVPFAQAMGYNHIPQHGKEVKSFFIGNGYALEFTKIETEEED